MSQGDPISLSKARRLARAYLNEHFPGTKACIAGSIRRKEKKVRDIDLVVLAPKLCGRQLKDEIEGVPVQVWFSDERCWGAMVLFVTGPAKYNIVCRAVAKRKGLKLSRYGLVNRETERPVRKAKTEYQILAAIGRTPKRPEDRQ